MCREVPKELCQTVFLNPKTVKVKDMVKYCANGEDGLTDKQTEVSNVRDEDFSKIERLRRPRENLQNDFIKSKQISNRERLLRFTRFTR